MGRGEVNKNGVANAETISLDGLLGGSTGLFSVWPQNSEGACMEPVCEGKTNFCAKPD